MAEKFVEPKDRKSVADTFKGRSVFITGATGFVGKVLLEKLMRSCREIYHIYVLIRPIKGDPRQRLESLFGEKVFDRIREECPDMFKKVIPLSGDVQSYDCGLTPEDLETMMEEVTIVFHCAASVRFDEKFRTALSVNVEGVRNVLELAQKMDCMEGFVHVSTAYAFCNWNGIQEEVYPENVKPDDLLTICKWMGDEELHLVFENVRNGRPTVYHYTKAIAENLIHRERAKVPVCIVRPSIITAAWKEPFPGWVDTYNGPSGLIAACGKGVVKTVHARPEVIADFIPVDVVASTIIIAAWDMIHDKPAIMVVNCTSNNLNPLTWGDIEKTCLPLLSKYPSMGLYRYPGGSFKKNAYHNKWSMTIHHTIPAYLIEGIGRLTFRRTRMVSLYKRIHNVLSYLEYFTTTQFDFQSENYLSLIEDLSEEDSKIFLVDIRPLKWTDYFEKYVLGVRKYLLNEDEETIPAARKRMNKIYYIDLLLKLTFICGSTLAMYRYGPRFIPRVVSSTYTLLAPGVTFVHEHVGNYVKIG